MVKRKMSRNGTAGKSGLASNGGKDLRNYRTGKNH